jgi:hypothetical protein
MPRRESPPLRGLRASFFILVGKFDPIQRIVSAARGKKYP